MEESRASCEERLATLSHILTFSESQRQGRSLGDRSKRQIEDWLTAEARLLIDRQDRDQLKQQRLQQIEQQFEEHRARKQRDIDQRLQASQANKNKKLETIQKKLSEVASRHQSVHARALSEKQHELDANFDSRRAYEHEPNRTASRLSRSSDRSVPTRPRAQAVENDEEIEGRLAKAQEASRERQLIALGKVREHNTLELQAAQEKAARALEQQISDFSVKIAGKLEGSQTHKQNHDRSLRHHQDQRQKAFSEKLRNYQTNLRHIHDEEASRLEELSKKFDRSLAATKTWKDEKGEVYHRKFLANCSLLEQKKLSRADQIMQKHVEITNKNKVYRERQHHLFQAIKCDPAAAP